MKQILTAALLILSVNISIAQYDDNRIGDTIRAVHYTIRLHDINTDDKTIQASTELKITPLIDDLQTVPLELKDLIVDSIIIDQTTHTFTHIDGIVRTNLLNPIDSDDTLTLNIF